jgi:hypothetical protein
MTINNRHDFHAFSAQAVGSAQKGIPGHRRMTESDPEATSCEKWPDV